MPPKKLAQKKKVGPVTGADRRQMIRATDYKQTYGGSPADSEVRAWMRRQQMNPRQLEQQQIRSLSAGLAKRIADPMSDPNLTGTPSENFMSKRNQLMDLLAKNPNYQFNWNRANPQRPGGNVSQQGMMRHLGVTEGPSAYWDKLRTNPLYGGAEGAEGTPPGQDFRQMLASYVSPNIAGEQPMGDLFGAHDSGDTLTQIKRNEWLNTLSPMDKMRAQNEMGYWSGGVPQMPTGPWTGSAPEGLDPGEMWEAQNNGVYSGLFTGGPEGTAPQFSPLYPSGQPKTPPLLGRPGGGDTFEPWQQGRQGRMQPRRRQGLPPGFARRPQLPPGLRRPKLPPGLGSRPRGLRALAYGS